ncbi:MAG: GNAT family N-acetyltransferase [Gammaproteobacteria bacterium]|nr:GNAT family N-acetyltransferase [Pseudomonadales bacterium]MCP5345401.1 GNAT family N-acetyltransferase [Pseudomonadales bacterium]
MKLEFENLADRPRDIPRVVAWWHTVWGERMGEIEVFTDKLLATLGGEQLPLTLVAVANGEPVGTAALKDHEMLDVFPGYQYWMGSVYVRPEWRERGVASQLAGHIIELAGTRGLPHLYLQTVHPQGGLYARLGWEPVERLLYRGDETLVMKKSMTEN